MTDHTSVQPAAEARPPEHVTVMPDEVAELLAGVPDGVIVDGTLGRGGHTKVLLGRGRTGLRILGLDRDLEAVEASRRILEPFGDRVRILHRGYEELREIVRELQLALLPESSWTWGFPASNWRRIGASRFGRDSRWTCGSIRTVTTRPPPN